MGRKKSALDFWNKIMINSFYTPHSDTQSIGRMTRHLDHDTPEVAEFITARGVDIQQEVRGDDMVMAMSYLIQAMRPPTSTGPKVADEIVLPGVGGVCTLTEMNSETFIKPESYKGMRYKIEDPYDKQNQRYNPLGSGVHGEGLRKWSAEGDS